MTTLVTWWKHNNMPIIRWQQCNDSYMATWWQCLLHEKHDDNDSWQQYDDIYIYISVWRELCKLKVLTGWDKTVNV